MPWDIGNGHGMAAHGMRVHWASGLFFGASISRGRRERASYRHLAGSVCGGG